MERQATPLSGHGDKFNSILQYLQEMENEERGARKDKFPQKDRPKESVNAPRDSKDRPAKADFQGLGGRGGSASPADAESPQKQTCGERTWVWDNWDLNHTLPLPPKADEGLPPGSSASGNDPLGSEAAAAAAEAEVDAQRASLRERKAVVAQLKTDLQQ
ncbi:unnamed protein product [Chrysoparadoxa australica]